MRTGAIISGVLHVAVIGLVIVGLPASDIPPPEETPILVELVEIADQTTPQRKPEPVAPKEPAKPEPPKPPEPPKAVEPPPPPPAPPPPEPKPEPAPPPPEPVKAPPPEPKPEPKPEPAPPPEPKPVPKPEPKPEPEPEPEPKKAEPKKEAEKPKPSLQAATPRPHEKPQPPKKEPEKKAPEKPNFDVGRIAALLDKSRKSEPAPSASPAKPTETKEALAPARPTDQPLTMSEIDAIRYQIEQCWSVPAGARDAEDLVVRIRVFLNPDGSLAKAPEIVETGRDDSFYRTASESARRAVLQCAPLKNLPTTKYERWRELTLTFNPRQMLGG